jgi:hypothetical protein
VLVESRGGRRKGPGWMQQGIEASAGTNLNKAMASAVAAGQPWLSKFVDSCASERRAAAAAAAGHPWFVCLYDRDL